MVYFIKNNFYEHKEVWMKKQLPPKKRLHNCDFPGCSEAGEYRAPRDRTLSSYYWFCQKHVAEYNKNWDFLKGLSPEEIENQKLIIAQDRNVQNYIRMSKLMKQRSYLYYW